jgi:drug/metabolite transporter (DMT)-like permease
VTKAARAGSPSPYLGLGAAVVCVSTGSILVRLAAAPPLAVSAYRVGLASLLIAPFAIARARAAWIDLGRRERLALVGCGIALALHFGTWIASLSYTSVAASVLLVNLAPLVTVLLSRIFLGETPRPAVVGAIALALVGAGLIATADLAAGPQPVKGDVLALLGAVTLSIYHVIGRGLRDALPLGAYVLAVWGTAALALVATALATRVPLAGFSPGTWAAFLGLALGPTLAGHGLVNLSLRALPAPVVGLFLLGEPVGATALAYLIFGEVPGLITLAGGLLVLAALAIALWSPRS